MISFETFREQIYQLHNQLTNGCGDSGCQIKKHKGQCTNGGCHCRPIDILDQLYQLVGQLEQYGRKTWVRDKPEESTSYCHYCGNTGNVTESVYGFKAEIVDCYKCKNKPENKMTDNSKTFPTKAK